MATVNRLRSSTSSRGKVEQAVKNTIFRFKFFFLLQRCLTISMPVNPIHKYHDAYMACRRQRRVVQNPNITNSIAYMCVMYPRRTYTYLGIGVYLYILIYDDGIWMTYDYTTREYGHAIYAVSIILGVQLVDSSEMQTDTIFTLLINTDIIEFETKCRRNISLTEKKICVQMTNDDGVYIICRYGINKGCPSIDG